MKQIRWGMIGTGRVTTTKSAPGLNKARRSTLCSVMSRTASQAAAYAAKNNVAKVYDNAIHLLNDPDIDAVYIATPPSSHKEYTIAAAKAGKAVYVEKPMAQDYAECCEMLAACERANVPLFVAYYRRSLPRFLKIKSLLDNGSIGEVRYVNMVFTKPTLAIDQKGIYHWHIDPAISKYGQFLNTGCHMIDTVQFLCGPITSVKGFAQNQAGLYKVPDSVMATFLFESGIHGVGAWNFSVHEQVDRTEIVGSLGTITYSTYSDTPIKLDIEGDVTLLEIPDPEHVQLPLIQSIVDELLGHGLCPSKGKTAATTNYWIDQIMADSGWVG